MASLSPDPPYLLTLCSPMANRSKTRSIVDLDIPSPVSITLKNTETGASPPSSGISHVTSRVTLPPEVNLTAFQQKLASTC